MVNLEQSIQQLLAAADKTNTAADRTEQAAAEATRAANGARAAANAATDAVHKVGREVAVLKRDFHFMWHAVFGPDVQPPAPPPPGVDPSLEPLPAWSKPPIIHVASTASERSTENTGDVAELRGQLLAIRTELGKQSSAMGLGAHGWTYLTSPKGLRSVLQVIGAVGAVIAAITALLRGPSPSSAAAGAVAPQAPVFVLPALPAPMPPTSPDAGASP